MRGAITIYPTDVKHNYYENFRTINLTTQIKWENSIKDKLPELKQDTDNMNNPTQLKN